MLTSILVGAISVCVFMLVLWVMHLALRNAAIVDVGWAAGVALVGAIYAAIGTGWGPRRVLIAVLVLIWGLRLSFFLLFTRVLGHAEEGRYVELRRKWVHQIPLKFLLFFQFQAVLCVVLSTPFLMAAQDGRESFSALEWAAVVVWAIAFVGELIADAQLHAFKAGSAHRGKTCDVGLWRYSRHPNYFFEWLIWVAFALLALGAHFGWMGLLSPLLMLFFLFRVTGIPATEAQALRTRGEEYRRYQQTTSAFVPWIPRKVSQ